MDFNHYLKNEKTEKAQVFVEPSKEARFLLKYFGWLVSPKDGKGNRFSQLLRMIIVSPFSQLSLFSFDYQSYTFEIFHQTKVARITHFICMLFVNLLVIAGLSQVSFFGNTPTTFLNIGLIYASILGIWYFIIAASQRLWLWGMVLVLVALAIGALGIYTGQTLLAGHPIQWLTLEAFYNPWLWAIVSAFLMTISHIPEPKLAPRVTPNNEWVAVQDFVLDKEHKENTHIIQRIIRLAFFPFWGTFNEFWASPKLMPYTFLAAMTNIGYAPKTYSKIQSYVSRALESGNPALDYVGIGGGSFIQLPKT
ncbi:MAG: hypothetical protein GY810_27470 [Aureispira sp.]|nr:hypothetical protein [Aureispira sp.]